MKKLLLVSALACTLCLATSTLFAADPELRADYPETYTVVKGDTLWDISERFLKDPWRWKEIWKGNNQIANPHLIYPGDVIRLIFVDGKPQLIAEREGSSTAITNTPTTQAPSSPTKKSDKKTLKTIKLSPKIYESELKVAVPNIPLEVINNFLSNNRVADVGELEQAPHVVAGQEKRVILGAGDTLYARGAFANDLASYGIYRQGQSYIDPETKEVLGVQALDIGAAGIRAIDDDVGTFTITRSTGEIRIGDRLLPHKEREITANFLPSPPENSVEGMIISMERGISQAGKLDIIAINIGKSQNIEEGHILAIFRRGEQIRDRFAKRKTSKTLTLPQERAGLVMVFQTFEKMSLAIVLEADRGVTVQDTVSNP